MKKPQEILNLEQKNNCKFRYNKHFDEGDYQYSLYEDGSVACLRMSVNKEDLIQDFPNLETIGFIGFIIGYVKDISILSNFPNLKKLYAGSSKIKDLDISQVGLKNIDLITHLTMLKTLILSGNKVKDMEKIVVFKYLESLHLSVCEIVDLDLCHHKKCLI